MAYDERLESLLLDYHLGQIPEAEAEEVRRALRQSAECRERLEEISRVLDLVPLGIPPTAPPAHLKDRVLAAAVESDARREPLPATDEPPAAPSGGRLRRLAPLLAAAALLVAVLAPLAFSYLQLRAENQRLEAEVQRLEERGGGELKVVPVEGTDRASGARGTVVLDQATGDLAFAAYDLPPAPGGHSYHAWLVGDAGPQDLGEMEPDSGGDVNMTGEAPDPGASYEALEVTVEPEGDVSGKTGPIYLRGKL